jgi:glycosyltransferase involved in cell wall biosynthesis
VTVANVFARAVIGNSRATIRSLTEIGVRPSKIHLVYNGFDAAKFIAPSPTKRQQIRERLGVASDTVLVGMFGRLDHWKGQHVFLEAVTQLPSVTALVVGEPVHGDGDYKASLVKAASGELGNRVRFLGFRDDISDLMAAADIVVHASVQPEPFGRVIVEAMLAGTPVVATNLGGVPEIMTNGRNGILVDPNDAGALRNAISQLIADRKMGEMMSRAARADMAERFTLQGSVAALMKILEEVSA